ncbi:O-antigen ligase family protein [Chitinophaga sp. RAB17]|uniref:O-antigen ligase family protein n=1 Tax=Chitinophaga sp. RAB17 TaxID=3233049 RepID=UPI003F92B09E
MIQLEYKDIAVNHMALDAAYNRHSKIANFFGSAIVLFLALGYPIQCAVPLFLKVNSTPVNAAFRVLIALASLVVIARVPFSMKKVSKGTFLLLLLWFIYSCRLFVDVSLRGIEFGNGRYSTFFMYSMAFANCFLPVIAVAAAAPYINIKQFLKWAFIFTFVSNIIIFVSFFTSNGITMALMSTRGAVGDDPSEAMINPITISFYGMLLAVLALSKLLFDAPKTIKGGIAFFICVIIGVANVLLGASRGPFLSLILSVCILFYFKLRMSRNTVSIVLKSALVIFMLLGGLMMSGIGSKIFSDDVFLFYRLTHFFDNVANGEKEDRDYEYASAWDQFSNHPFIGDKYVTDHSHIYPHNVFLELLMSLGAVGGILFLLILFEVLIKAGHASRYRLHRHIALLLILLGYLLLSMTSGGIFITPGLWILLALFFEIKNKPFDESLN